MCFGGVGVRVHIPSPFCARNSVTNISWLPPIDPIFSGFPLARSLCVPANEPTCVKSFISHESCFDVEHALKITHHQALISCIFLFICVSTCYSVSLYFLLSPPLSRSLLSFQFVSRGPIQFLIFLLPYFLLLLSCLDIIALCIYRRRNTGLSTHGLEV